MRLLTGFTLLLVLQMAGEVVVRLTGLDVPGPVVGLLLLVVALALVPAFERRVAEAADALLAHLSLLFVPAGVGVVVHLGRLDGAVLGVAATLFGSTVLGLVVTALTLQWLLRRGGGDPGDGAGAADGTGSVGAADRPSVAGGAERADGVQEGAGDRGGNRGGDRAGDRGGDRAAHG